MPSWVGGQQQSAAQLAHAVIGLRVSMTVSNSAEWAQMILTGLAEQIDHVHGRSDRAFPCGHLNQGSVTTCLGANSGAGVQMSSSNPAGSSVPSEVVVSKAARQAARSP
jgi:hypothetical protein